MKTTKRITGKTLQKIRERLLSHNPLCVICEKAGFFRVATEIDHVIPLFKGGLDHDSNRQPLCKECHEKKTAEDRGWRYRPREPKGLDW